MELQTIDTLGLGSVSRAASPRSSVARIRGAYLVQRVLWSGVASNADEFDAAARRSGHFSEVPSVPPATSDGSATLIEILAAVAASTAAAVRRFQAARRRSRDAHATYLALRELDARTLKDLGLDRSELRSAAAELASEVDRTRTLALRASHASSF